MTKFRRCASRLVSIWGPWGLLLRQATAGFGLIEGLVIRFVGFTGLAGFVGFIKFMGRMGVCVCVCLGFVGFVYRYKWFIRVIGCIGLTRRLLMSWVRVPWDECILPEKGAALEP